jgi:hypothetical protein
MISLAPEPPDGEGPKKAGFGALGFAPNPEGKK